MWILVLCLRVTILKELDKEIFEGFLYILIFLSVFLALKEKNND